jgi:hypothetical protein
VNTITTLTRRAEDKMEAHSAAYHPHTSSTTLGEIEIMKLEDVSRQGADIARAESNVYAPTVKLLLQLCQRFYTNERMIRFFGDKNKATVVKFKGSDLHFEDVMIVPGTSLKKSRALQVQMALRAAELGMFSSQDPQEAARLRQDLADHLTLNLTVESTDDQLDTNNAKDENQQMLEGIEPPVEWSDNHFIHKRWHMRVLKSSDFRNLPEPTKTTVRAIVMHHNDMHTEAMEADLAQGEIGMRIAAEAAMAQQQGGMGGAVGGAMPTADGRMLVPQEAPGSPKSGNLVGGGFEGGGVIPGGEPGMGAELPVSGEQ